MLPTSLASHQAQPSPLRPYLHPPNPTIPISTFLPPPTSPTRVTRRRGGKGTTLSTSSADSIRMGVSSSKWWWQRALGQRFNREGAASFLSVALAEPHLALPHLMVPDIRWVDWPALRRLGFRGVVFDKDNTLTAPYSLAVWPPIYRSLCLCRSSFPAGSIAVFSNSAGLEQYDPDGTEAKALEEAIGGIHVIRHEVKKPAGTAEDVERYFGCSASNLVMVGDRIFTDVVYGNRHGFLTILTEPLSLSEEPFIVKQVRKLERLLVNSWYHKATIDHAVMGHSEGANKIQAEAASRS